ncbi:MAG: iron-sulfur cluster biosynthesis transcriptional regulator SufR [Spirulinaceae cyanobacterium]
MLSKQKKNFSCPRNTDTTAQMMTTTTETSSTKQDILNHLLKQGQASAQQLAQALEISPQATRRHLKELESSELLEHHTTQTGMGRPQHLYKLSRQGRNRFPNRHGEFAVSFLDTLVETVGEEQVSEVLRKQWEVKASNYRKYLGKGSLPQRLNNLVQLRKEEGYMAELHNLPEAEKFVLVEHNCAIADVAESYPTVCGHELEMFSAILPDCVVERTHWINEGEHLCGYLIEAK